MSEDENEDNPTADEVEDKKVTKTKKRKKAATKRKPKKLSANGKNNDPAESKGDDDVEASTNDEELDLTGSDASISESQGEPVQGDLNLKDAIIPAFGTLGPLARQAPKQNIVKLAYLLFLIGGFLIILFGKLLVHLPSLLMACLAVVAIISYAAMGFYADRHNRIRVDQVGDNCYYLGLTYTLASLIAAILSLGGGNVGRELLDNFGIALFSTAAGIIARLFLMQFRTELDDAETDARIRLIDASEDFRQQLFSASADFQNFQTSIIMGLESTQTQISDLLRKQSEQLADSVDGSVKVIDERVQTLDSLLEAFESRFGVLEQFTESLGLAAKSLSDRMNDIHTRPQAIEEAFDRMSQGLDNTSIALNESVTAMTDKLAGSSEFDEVVGRLSVRLRDIDAIVEQMQTNVNAQSETIANGTEFLEQHTEALKSYTNEATVEGRKMREATEEVYGALGDLAQAVVKGVKRG